MTVSELKPKDHFTMAEDNLFTRVYGTSKLCQYEGEADVVFFGHTVKMFNFTFEKELCENGVRIASVSTDKDFPVIKIDMSALSKTLDSIGIKPSPENDI